MSYGLRGALLALFVVFLSGPVFSQAGQSTADIKAQRKVAIEACERIVREHIMKTSGPDDIFFNHDKIIDQSRDNEFSFGWLTGAIELRFGKPYDTKRSLRPSVSCMGDMKRRTIIWVIVNSERILREPVKF